MIKAVFGRCYSATSEYIINEKNRSLEAINLTINRIGKDNLALAAGCLFYCLFQHNLVILGAAAGFIWNVQVSSISKKISNLFNYYLHIVEPLVNRYQICGWKVLFPIVHGTVLVVSILAIIILKPVSTMIIPPILLGAMLAANLVTAANNHAGNVPAQANV